MEDYRKKFKKYYGVNFGKEYEIHHIDLNHENNEIDNLMILPKKLHQDYHTLLKCTYDHGNIFEKKFNAKIYGNVANYQLNYQKIQN